MVLTLRVGHADELMTLTPQHPQMVGRPHADFPVAALPLVPEAPSSDSSTPGPDAWALWERVSTCLGVTWAEVALGLLLTGWGSTLHRTETRRLGEAPTAGGVSTSSPPRWGPDAACGGEQHLRLTRAPPRGAEGPCSAHQPRPRGFRQVPGETAVLHSEVIHVFKAS